MPFDVTLVNLSNWCIFKHISYKMLYSCKQKLFLPKYFIKYFVRKFVCNDIFKNFSVNSNAFTRKKKEVPKFMFKYLREISAYFYPYLIKGITFRHWLFSWKTDHNWLSTKRVFARFSQRKCLRFKDYGEFIYYLKSIQEAFS